MKKFTFIFTLMLMLGVARSYAQMPDCANDNGLKARIKAIEAAGWTQISCNYFAVAYLLPPSPPYLTGTLEVTFVGPYCGPACTPGIRVEAFDVYITNDQGNCTWRLGGN